MLRPKLLIKTFRPVLLVVLASLGFIAFNQYKDVEESALSQSQNNIQMAKALLDGKVKSSIGLLYALEATLISDGENDFFALAKREVNGDGGYHDIGILYLDNYSYVTTDGSTHPYHQKRAEFKPIWHINRIGTHAYGISSLYKNHNNKWVFALKKTIKAKKRYKAALIIEFDPLYFSQQFTNLKTLSDGYLFVIDRETKQVLIHPDNNRIATPSVSFHQQLQATINQGTLFGKSEYVYLGRQKMAVFDADNPYNWVILSGTNAYDIISHFSEFGLTTFIIAAILSFVLFINFISFRLNQQLNKLNKIHTFDEFKVVTEELLREFCYCKSTSLCIYDANQQSFIELLTTGQRTLNEKINPNLYSHHTISYLKVSKSDPLVKALGLQGRYYRIPLMNDGALLGVVHIQVSHPTYRSLLRVIRSYVQISLSNLLLKEELRYTDPATKLKNKNYLRLAFHKAQVSLNPYYFAILDLDNFKKINDKYGHLCGDDVIFQTAILMKQHFPAPTSTLSRYGGEEFCIIFTAYSEEEAYQYIDSLRRDISKRAISTQGHSFHFTISAGICQVNSDFDQVVSLADEALYHAKNEGKNQVYVSSVDQNSVILKTYLSKSAHSSMTVTKPSVQ
ncbi:GGDEF domain-containing protein [Vibrio sp. Of7-15]|uniref:diguanylate cyclase domain-containing protein n=1 Tax=Vibrio sp. Of7-15 TaxID=2724879 RepID=UPI001EF200AA|nr:diguanylate cyclase [Vibrio sp. Of7-15]MCG7497255.1 GGDEF domain-containing protein [Vibrio sp. Of7-15]